VADKGMAAALFMTLTRTVVRTSVLHGRGAAEAISAANRVICGDAAAGMFVTLCYAQLNCGTGELLLVNAGHPAPLLYRAACDELSELMPHGLPLGISDAAQFPEERLLLEPGDFILLYTDGVTDALDKSEEFFVVGCRASFAASTQPAPL